MVGPAMDDRALVEVCAALAAARQGLAAGGAVPLAGLSRRMAQALAAGDPRAVSPVLIAVLDELTGLVGQLELERAALGSRLAAFERHRQARRSYSLGAAGS